MLDEDQSFIAIIGLICHYEELKCAKLVVRLRERLRVGLRPRKTGNKLKWRYFIFYVGNIKSVGELGRMGAALDITVWGIIREVVRSLTLWQSGIDPLTMAMGMVVMVKFFFYLTGWSFRPGAWFAMNLSRSRFSSGKQLQFNLNSQLPTFLFWNYLNFQPFRSCVTNANYTK